LSLSSGVIARLGTAAVALLIAGCAAAPRPVAEPLHPPSSELRAFLADPAAAGPLDPALRPLWDELLAGKRAGALLAQLDALPASALEAPSGRLLAAEVAVVAGDWERAALEIGRMPEPGLPAAALLAGRIAEGRGDPIEAVEAYRRVSGSEVARERAARLGPAAIRELRRRIDEELAAGRGASAAGAVERLATLDPESDETWLREARVAAATGEAVRELTARRRLARAGLESFEDSLRRGLLEVEVGDSSVGLALLDGLRAEHPGDARADATLAEAHFRFRLANSPEAVRRSAAAAVLSRADFARLLYWLLPGVRSAPVPRTTIATDILDHPAREEIVKVASLGLLPIDETLHLFEPARPLRRIAAFRALLRARGAPDGDATTLLTEASACAGAVRLGWAGEPAECLPEGAVSGREALAWIRGIVEAPGARP